MSEAQVFELEVPTTPNGGRRHLAIIGTIVVVLTGLLGGATYLLTVTYQDKILPHVQVAGIDVGGLDRLGANELLQQHFQSMIQNGLEVELFGEVHHIELQPSGATDPDLVYQLADWDITQSVEEALLVGRRHGQVAAWLAPLYYVTIGQAHVEPTITLAETRLSDAIRASFPTAESPGSPTDFVITGSKDDSSIEITPAVEGAILDLPFALASIKNDAADLKLNTLELRLVERTLGISVKEAEQLIPQAQAAIAASPYVLVFQPEYGDVLEYVVTDNDLRTWLLPGRDERGQPAITLNAADMKSFLGEIHTAIDIAPQDATFVVEGDRVVEFAESHDGFIINDDTLLADLTRALGAENQRVAIASERTAPDVTTADSNDLGIDQVLGVGYSNFSGSPTNRRANIRHGAEKLNGLLVPPGETLSLLEHLRPFTVADGYLPELVIKGDEIIPEVGGGLCQIGTTTFRAAMNSGLVIAERRNHSLVVSYYNDPSNNNPGTDATIYDPSPDLKITNDTPNYIMLQTVMDAENSELHFTFWGTSDGRTAHYTPPQVLSWTGYGPAVEKETTTLAPGVRKCQAPHPGATTTFDYIITRPDGTIETTPFFSSYRSLPSVCLVGAAAPGSPPPSGELTIE